MNTRPASGNEAELYECALALAGRTLGEIASQCGLSAGPRSRDKGLAGRLLEHALGAEAGSVDGPDFPDLGIELKTIPTRLDGRPSESTFVCALSLVSVGDEEWECSRASRKLQRVLWVPVEATPGLQFPERRVGRPILWSPSASQHAVLRADWCELTGRLAAGHAEMLTARVGRYLQVRPKAAHAGCRTLGCDADGGLLRTQPRGLYLRRSFTARLIESALR